jgi:hypothetical protein
VDYPLILLFISLDIKHTCWPRSVIRKRLILYCNLHTRRHESRIPACLFPNSLRDLTSHSAITQGQSNERPCNGLGTCVARYASYLVPSAHELIMVEILLGKA